MNGPVHLPNGKEMLKTIYDLYKMKKHPDNKLDSKCIVGIVQQLVSSKDGKVCRVIVKYSNPYEFPVT